MAESPAGSKDVADALEAIARRMRAPRDAAPGIPMGGATLTPYVTAEEWVDDEPALGALEVLNDGRHLSVTVETRNVSPGSVHVSLTQTRLVIGLGEEGRASRRDLPLPADVDADAAVATLRNGVLDVVLPIKSA